MCFKFLWIGEENMSSLRGKGDCGCVFIYFKYTQKSDTMGVDSCLQVFLWYFHQIHFLQYGSEKRY
jgi:hypothetical protein